MSLANLTAMIWLQTLKANVNGGLSDSDFRELVRSSIDRVEKRSLTQVAAFDRERGGILNQLETAAQHIQEMSLTVARMASISSLEVKWAMEGDVKVTEVDGAHSSWRGGDQLMTREMPSEEELGNLNVGELVHLARYMTPGGGMQWLRTAEGGFACPHCMRIVEKLGVNGGDSDE